jgi:O-antigen biosynthesis protein
VIVPAHKTSPVVPNGKFFRRGSEKFFLKAIRIQPPSSLAALEEKIAVRKRLGDLHAAHATTVVVPDIGPGLLLDLVGQSGLYALQEVRVEPLDLFSRHSLRRAILGLRKGITDLRGKRGVIGYLLDCPIRPDVLRSSGLKRARAGLAEIVAAIRDGDPSWMVGLKQQLGTLALTLQDEDFVYAVMPQLTSGELCSPVIRLHNLAEARPLVLEFGQIGSAEQELVNCAFGLGAAGVVVQACAGGYRPPVPFKGGSHSPKMLQAHDPLPFLALNGTCPPLPARTPMVSVVICAYNAERTMRRCLESLRKLDYPNFEVIIVDDGSRDATPQIAAEFAEFRLIRQPNKGLSTARNVGLQAALGEFIAYTDSDCVVDPHWLTLMVRALLDRELDGCGGPNYAPHEDGWVEACVAASPGAPSHVLIDDDRAEHLAGCNMVFKKAALEDVGGFDSQFTAAGDDVDICWRLMEAGYLLGYCPSAFVWHFRRNTVKAYYRQQRGYGKAEALLYCKYPRRFNSLGQIKWNGTIPGVSRTIPGGGRRRVQWVRTAEQLQGLKERPLSMLAVTPMTAEWSLLVGGLIGLCLLFGVTIWPALAAFMAAPLWAAYYAMKAPLEKCHRGPASRLLIGFLAYSGSIARTFARYRWRADARTRALFDNGLRQRPAIDWKRRSIRLSYWNGVYTTRDTMLEKLSRLFTSLGRPVSADSGWNDFDLLVEPNPWARIQFKTADEELGGLELRTNIAARFRMSTVARVGLGACLIVVAMASVFASVPATVALSIVAVGVAVGVLSGLGESVSLAYHAIEQCAAELDLVPLGKPAVPARIPPIPAAVDPDRPAEAVQPAGH